MSTETPPFLSRLADGVEFSGGSTLVLGFFVSLAVVLVAWAVVAGTLRRAEKRELLLSLGVAVRRVGRTIRETTRKSFHFLGAVVPMVYYAGQVVRVDGAPLIPRAAAATVLGTLAAVQVAVEVARAASPRFAAAYVRAAGPLLRERERDGAVTAVTSYMLGCAISVAAFPPHVAMGAILTLVLGDAAGALVGVSFGRTKLSAVGNGSKSLEGTLAVFATSAVVWLAMLSGAGPGPVEFAVLAGALAGALAELFPMRFDDNVAIPVASGLAVCAAAWRLGINLEGGVAV
jgi:dolichol kinase